MSMQDDIDVSLMATSPFFGSDPHAFVVGLTPGSTSMLYDLRRFAFMTLLLSVLHCFLISTFYMAVTSLLKNGLSSTPNRLYMAAISTMFLLTTVYVVLVVVQFWVAFDLGADTYSTLRNIGYWFESGAFAVNVILGDAIILWRALVIWRWRKLLVYISGFLLLATAALWLYAVIGAGGTSSFVSIPASMATSLWATGAIFTKAWQRRRMLRQKVVVISRNGALENVLAMLTESGVVFTLLWLVFFAANFAPSESFYTTMTVVMIIAASLYPTMVIILIARETTPLSDELTGIETFTVPETEREDLLSEATHHDVEK